VLPKAKNLEWQKFVEEGHKNKEAWNKFVVYVHEQVRELMSNYGRIDALFYDGGWYQTAAQWKSRKLNDMVRQLQPQILINDRAMVYEDFTTPENEIPVHLENRDEPWEVCYCVNDTWGHIPSDINYKSVRQCIHSLIRVRSAGGNLILNADPDGNGEMPTKFAHVMRGLGAWVAKNSDSIYGCRLAAMAEHSTGFYSQPGMVTANPAKGLAYYHILRWLGGNNHCVKIEVDVISARFLVGGKNVKFARQGQMIYFYLPVKAPDPIDTVIELKYRKGSERIKWKRSYV
jgi:alpha-L-fucosidase